MQIVTVSTLSETTITALFQRYFRSHTAYALLGSTHGYSLSELQSESKNPPTYKQEYAILTPNQNIAGVFRIDQQDTISKSLRLMLDISDNTAHHILAYRCIEEQLLTLRENTPEIKIYTYLLPHEDRNKLLLTEFGFQREALLDEHVFASGHYYDLEIWGSPRQRVA